MQKVYFIQGVFFQPHLELTNALNASDGPEKIGGPGNRAHFLGSEMLHASFAGRIAPTPDQEHFQLGKGFLVDSYGESELSNVVLTDTQLSFTKKYKGREDEIHYFFEKEYGVWEEYSIWVGAYRGYDAGRGTAKCVLSEVDAEFLLDPRPELREKINIPELKFKVDDKFSVLADSVPVRVCVHYKITDINRCTSDTVLVKANRTEKGLEGEVSVRRVPIGADLKDLEQRYF